MKIKIEKSYANCYYIMLLSIFITGYTLRSSILPGVFGYINFAFYISMFIILMRWIKYFNISHIMIISAIFGGILYVDIMTGSNIYKSINSIFGFVLPLEWWSAILVGILGIPGAIILVIIQFFM